MTLNEEDLGPDHLDLVKTLVALYPGVAEIATIAERVGREAGYPIPSFTDLMESMGGPDATVEVLGRSVRLRTLRRFIPPYYFPISNQNDLVAKLHHIWANARRQ